LKPPPQARRDGGAMSATHAAIVRCEAAEGESFAEIIAW
jgi:hypothetical protein